MDLFELARTCGPWQLQAAIGGGADVNARDMEDNTPLIAASYYQCLEVASELIKAGADVNARNVFGHTALMVAAMYCEAPDIATALLRAGADAKVKDAKARTALDYAQENWRLAGTEAYRLLEEASR